MSNADIALEQYMHADHIPSSESRTCAIYRQYTNSWCADTAAHMNCPNIIVFTNSQARAGDQLLASDVLYGYARDLYVEHLLLRFGNYQTLYSTLYLYICSLEYLRKTCLTSDGSLHYPCFRTLLLLTWLSLDGHSSFGNFLTLTRPYTESLSHNSSSQHLWLVSCCPVN